MQIVCPTEWLFFHLWKRNPITDTSCPMILIPDTIIYRWSQPFFWYFMTKSGRIGRKKREKIDLKNIQKFLTKKIKDHGICSKYMHELSSSSLKSKICVEFFNEKELYNFLVLREKDQNALLQGFVDPIDNHNSKKNALLNNSDDKGRMVSLDFDNDQKDKR